MKILSLCSKTTIAVKKSEQREILLGALTEISDGDPLLKYYVDTTTHEIILSFLGNVQMEVICAILEEKYHVEAEIKEPTVIYMERPLRKAEYTIHIEVPPNPFWASVGLSIEPLPIGSGVQYESRVSLGYLNQSFPKCGYGGGSLWLRAGAVWMESDRL